MTDANVYVGRLDTKTGHMDVLPACLYIFKDKNGDETERILEFITPEDGLIECVTHAGREYDVYRVIRGEDEYRYFWTVQLDPLDVLTSRNIFRRHLQKRFNDELKWADREKTLLEKLEASKPAGSKKEK